MQTRVRLSIALAVACAAIAAGAPAAFASPFVGMTSEDTYAKGGRYADSQLAAMHRAHVGLLRQTFDWSFIQYGGQAYNFGATDSLVLAAARHRIRILPVLFNPPPFLSSAPPNPRRGTYPPRNPGDLAAFAQALVRRYGPNGSLWAGKGSLRRYAIRDWQWWNEPTLPVYWPDGPNAVSYVALLRVVYNAIKQVDPGADIVSAGLPPSHLPGAVPIFSFMTRMLSAGGGSALNTLAVNSYARNAGELSRLIKKTRSIMNRHGARRAKIWITELGWCDKGARSRFCVGRRGQARNITSSFGLLRKVRRRLGIRGVVYFSWRDGRPYPPLFQNFWGLHTGLLNVRGKRKAAFKAFTGATRGL